MNAPPPLTLLPRYTALISALCGAALAQSAAPAAAPLVAPAATTCAGLPTNLSFGEVLAALRRSVGYRSAEEAYKSAQYNLDAARARAGLNLGAGASATAYKVPLDADLKSSLTLTAQISAAVLPWGSAFDSVRSAERTLQRAAYDFRDAQQNLTLTAAQDYLAAQAAQQTLSLTQTQAALAQRQLDVVRQQRENNLITAEGLLESQANQENAQAAAQDAQDAREVAVRQLISDLSLSAGPAACLNIDLSNAPSLPAAAPDIAALLDAAQQRRSEVLKAASQLADAQAALTTAQRERWPGLSASLNYGELPDASGNAGRLLSGGLDFKTGVANASVNYPTSSTTVVSTASGTGVAATTNRPTSLSLGLSGTVDILGSAANAAIRGAQSSVNSAQLALQSARSSVELDVRRAENDLQSALRAAGVQRTALTRAQTALDSSRARLGAGLSTALDVQNAEAALLSAQNAYQQAVSKAYLSSLRLSKAAAQLDPALILPQVAPTTTPTPAAPAAPGAKP